jgi:hypothetical protein
MNIIDKFLLTLVLLPKRIYQKIGIDFLKLKSILHFKLVMDDRRSTSMELMRMRPGNSPKEAAKSSAIFNFILNAIMGIIFLLAFSVGKDNITHLTSYFSLFVIYLSMMLISDFTSVLIDVRDNFIIIPKPVDGKTVVSARLLHIFIHLIKTVFPLAVPALIYLVLNESAIAGLIFPIVLLFATIFTIFLINATYIFILVITTPEKFKNILLYIQILFAIIVYASSQLLPRFMDKIGYLNLDMSALKWAIFLPFYWFACLFNWLFTLHASSPEMISAMLAIFIPIASIYIVIVYLAPYFNQKLSMIAGSEGDIQPNSKKSSLQKIGNGLATMLATNPTEKVGFLFSWKMMARSRDFKLKVYPNFGYILVMFAGVILQIFRDLDKVNSDKVDQESGIIFIIYVSPILVLVAKHQLTYSEKFKASWMFFSSPIKNPGQILSGSIKAVLCQFHSITVVILSLISIVLFGGSFIPNVFLGVINQILITYTFAVIQSKNIPFSVNSEQAHKSGAFIRTMLQFLLFAIIGTLHYFIFTNLILISISIVLSLTGIYFLSRRIKSLTWYEIQTSR